MKNDKEKWIKALSYVAHCFNMPSTTKYQAAMPSRHTLAFLCLAFCNPQA